MAAISRYDYSQQFGDISPLIEDLKDLLLGGNYILGKDVERFESEFANYCQCNFSRGVNSGTDALVIAMRALGVGRGDEVITAANTFHATVAAIELTGATPVLVDADPTTFLLNEAQLDAVVSPRTKAVVPVHLFGKPVNMYSLLAFAERHHLLVIEDAAQAHGAAIDGQRVGSFGAAGCFSFHPSKNLAAAGDAGAVVTSDPQVACAIEMHRSLGQRAQNEHLIVGLNSKLDGIQARVLTWKLRHLDEWNRSRAQTADLYRSGLTGLPITYQATHGNEVHVYHLFQIRTQVRDRLASFLKAKGIDAVIRYPTPIHLQPAFAHWEWRQGQFPVAEQLARELLCLPIRPAMPESEVGHVIDTVRAFFSNAA